MITSWRRRRAARRNAKKQNSDHGGGGGAAELAVAIPSHFLCPISLQLMKDPVTLTTGTTYDRPSIETWLDSGNSTCPVTNQVLTNLDPVPNHAIRRMIQEWCGSRGVERIPTPRVPMASYEVSNIFARIEEAIKYGDGDACREVAAKMKESAKESDRNRRCFVSNGAGRILSAAFVAFSRDNADESAAVLEEVLSAMVALTPALEEETSRNLSSPPSLRRIVWCMRFGNLSVRRNAALALKSVLSFDQDTADDVAAIDGALAALMKLIEEPICPTATKASLLSMYYLVKPPESDDQWRRKEAIAAKLAEMGLVSILIEMAVDSERSTCEKVLGVLDGMCSYGEVRERGRENALMVPVVVKKLLRVSDVATEFAMSILWKVVRDEMAAVEAMGVGAFEKVLVVLQIGGDERTKEKATEVLKAMNGYRSRVQCVDSLDFKHVKRPF